MRLLVTFFVLLLLSVRCCAQDAETLVSALAQGSFKERETAVSALAASGSDVTVSVLEALAAGNLHVRKSDQKVFITTANGDVLALVDPYWTSRHWRSAKS